jgi:hypothetical protein
MFLKLGPNAGFNLSQIRHLTFIRLSIQNLRDGLDMFVELLFLGWGHDLTLRKKG